MIVKKFYRTRIDGKDLYRIYSDNNSPIRNTLTDDVDYEFIYIEGMPFVYEETALPIEPIIDL